MCSEMHRRALQEPGRVSRAEAALLRRGLVEVLDLDDPQATAAWAACDLASMVEGCFHARLDPWCAGEGLLEEAAREPWLSRLGASYLSPGFADDAWMTRYLWLLSDGERAGTMALPTTATGTADLGLWSLYVHPAYRGAGLATQVLQACYEAARAAGFRGLRIDTHWAWQRALRFYLSRRMWVTSWKRSIGLVFWPRLPEWDLEEGPDRVTFRVRRGDAMEPLWTARRRGACLELTEEPRTRSLGAEETEADERVHGHATLAVVLATRGWPLIRSERARTARTRSRDIGPVEGLADEIRQIEAARREEGWDLRTPEIPGLPTR